MTGALSASSPSPAPRLSRWQWAFFVGLIGVAWTGVGWFVMGITALDSMDAPVKPYDDAELLAALFLPVVVSILLLVQRLPNRYVRATCQTLAVLLTLTWIVCVVVLLSYVN